MMKIPRIPTAAVNPIESKLYPVFEKAGTVQNYKKNEMIYFQGDPADTFYLIKSGRVRLFLISKEGTELTLEILRAGELFGEASYFSYIHRITSVSAVTDVELLAVDMERLFPYLTKHPEIMVEMFKIMAQKIRKLSMQVNSMVFFSADKKVAHILVQLGTFFKANIEDAFYSIDYTHQEISELVGICRVTVTKVLKQFEKKDWLLLEYRKVKILNDSALQQFLLS